MTHVALVRSALFDLIASVPEVGRVHAYQRFASREAEMKALYVANIGGADQLRGWFVTRTATRERAFTLTTTVQRVSWTIVGYMALADADQSELSFDWLVEAIRAAWRANPTLGGLVAPVASDDEAGIQVDELATVLFCGVLCHQARLSLKTEFEI
ncbi:hypothetical protein [Zoogloea sp.]|uniref:hypothetical protein n=1 Tax=Zoogloea sp. TaxID=49181 RepID=UPI00261B42F6|nr:hypothetical protein [Zoogloea sp.]